MKEKDEKLEAALLRVTGDPEKTKIKLKEAMLVRLVLEEFILYGKYYVNAIMVSSFCLRPSLNVKQRINYCIGMYFSLELLKNHTVIDIKNEIERLFFELCAFDMPKEMITSDTKLGISDGVQIRYQNQNNTEKGTK